VVVNAAPKSVSSCSGAWDVSTLRRVFASIHAESCPTHFNFHMHTICSDGQLHPVDLIEQAIAIGLSGLAITDHHSVDGYRIAKTWLDNQPEKDDGSLLPHLWTGIEVTARLLDTEIHILGYAFNPSSSYMAPYLKQQPPDPFNAQAGQVISSIHEAGGLAVLAHPVRYRRSPHDLIPEAARLGIDGIETYYAYNNPSPWRTSPEQTLIVQELGVRYNLLNTCGTDTHGRSLLQRL